MDDPPASPSNLPTYGTPFIGRDEDAAAVAGLLCAPATRWLSLVGASGAGKTRLSLHVAETLADRFPDGRFFVSLAPVTDPVLVLPAIMRLLSIREVGGESPLETLGKALASRSMLLIIDNVEQVKQVGPTLEALLERTTRLKLLLTSQESLGVRMERIHQVPPLAIPPDGAALPISDLLTYPAIALFVDRFMARQRDFVFHENNADDVIEICRQVRGLPLAIELIAACNTALSPRDLLFLLRNYLALGRGGIQSRDRILGPVLDWCYSRLHPDCRTVLGLFGVFAGGCTRESMQAICAEFYPEIDVGATLTMLSDKYLIMTETLSPTITLYIMLDVVAEYTAQLFGKFANIQEIHQAHSRFYRALAERSADGMKGPEQDHWRLLMESEHHNLRAALRWIANQPPAGAMLQMTGALARFWFIQGYLSEGRVWCEAALDRDRGTVEHKARAHHGAGMLAYGVGDYRQATEHYQRALDLRRAQGDEPGVGSMLNNLGLVALNQGDHAQARPLLEEALEIWQRHGKLWDQANTLNSLGIVANEQGRFGEALRYYQQSLALWRELEYAMGVAMALNNVGELALYQDQYAEAEAALGESLEFWRAANDQMFVGDVLANLGYADLAQGRLDSAEARFSEGGRTKYQIHDQRGVATSLEGLATVRAARGDSLTAAHLFGAAAALRARLAAPVPQLELPRYERSVAQARAGLAAAQFDQAWQEGGAWPLEQALECAGILAAALVAREDSHEA